ncbi:hypothetical protein GDO81_002120 [Engystomops pustulosus]|uniref:5'-AMP-activated protein kinase subunit beta-1 n=1 Tax=Engystomops pustulosus TaxID=76066 RepID=A0AAV7DHH1_ENGPU|nr:hypothetical protein GDO81_002120 [Engystomops pustulosus]
MPPSGHLRECYTQEAVTSLASPVEPAHSPPSSCRDPRCTIAAVIRRQRGVNRTAYHRPPETGGGSRQDHKQSPRRFVVCPAVNMGNTSSERPGPLKGRRDSGGGASKGEDRTKILMDSPEDADMYPAEENKAPLEKDEFLAWQHDLEVNDKAPTQARPTVFRWTGGGKEIYLSGSFNNWGKIPLIRSHNNFVAILDLPEGDHQYKFFVDGQWTHDPAEPVVTSQLGTINNVINVKKTDFEVFDALMVDSQKGSDLSELSSSPPGPYQQDPYNCKLEERFKNPPILPPHLLQVILNKDTGISCDPALLPEPNHVMLNHLYALSIKVSTLTSMC